MNNTTRIETRAVLAGAYKSSAKNLLTHVVEISDDGCDGNALCKRVLPDHLADKFSLTETERNERPTCPRCGGIWDKRHGGQG